MKNKKGLYLLQTILGITFIIIGGFILNSEETKMLSGLFIGIGSAGTALGLGWFIQSLVIPESKMKKLQRQKAIEQIDERNIRIRERTGYMAGKITDYVFMGFILVLGFMGVDKVIIAIAALVLVIKVVLVIFLSNYYAKNM
jgi:hypothetical protein